MEVQYHTIFGGEVQAQYRTKNSGWMASLIMTALYGVYCRKHYQKQPPKWGMNDIFKKKKAEFGILSRTTFHSEELNVIT